MIKVWRMVTPHLCAIITWLALAQTMRLRNAVWKQLGSKAIVLTNPLGHRAQRACYTIAQ